MESTYAAGLQGRGIAGSRLTAEKGASRKLSCRAPGLDAVPRNDAGTIDHSVSDGKNHRLAPDGDWHGLSPGH